MQIAEAALQGGDNKPNEERNVVVVGGNGRIQCTKLRNKITIEDVPTREEDTFVLVASETSLPSFLHPIVSIPLPSCRSN
jgi:uncharacterized protein (UPF0248 family)